MNAQRRKFERTFDVEITRGFDASIVVDLTGVFALVRFARFENTQNASGHVLMIFETFVSFQLEDGIRQLFSQSVRRLVTSRGMPFLNHLTGADGSLT